MLPTCLNEIGNLNPSLFSTMFIHLAHEYNVLPQDMLDSSYFQDYDYFIMNKDRDSKIHLLRGAEIPYFVEKINQSSINLQWLIPGFNPKLLPFYFVHDESSMICLNDSWSLLGWVNQLLNHTSSMPDDNESITLIHYDSHTDLMAPLIGQNLQGELINFISGQLFNVRSFWDVFIAICSGSIGIGSFITLLPLLFKKIKIFHINQFSTEKKHRAFSYDLFDDLIFTKKFRGYKRLGLNFSEPDISLENKYQYYLSNLFNDFVNDIPNDTNIYLHIDMDYFNNRYDGSRQTFRNPLHDTNLYKQKQMLNEMIEEITPYANKIIHTSLALSPGFFPSEYWSDMTQLVMSSLNNIGVTVNPSKIFPKTQTM